MYPIEPDRPLTGFRMWYAEAERGDFFVYHTGDLAVDRWDWENGGVPLEPLDGLARLVMHYSDQGLVALTQSRLGNGKSEYRATKI